MRRLLSVAALALAAASFSGCFNVDKPTCSYACSDTDPQVPRGLRVPLRRLLPPDGHHRRVRLLRRRGAARHVRCPAISPAPIPARPATDAPEPLLGGRSAPIRGTIRGRPCHEQPALPSYVRQVRAVAPICARRHGRDLSRGARRGRRRREAVPRQEGPRRSRRARPDRAPPRRSQGRGPPQPHQRRAGVRRRPRRRRALRRDGADRGARSARGVEPHRRAALAHSARRRALRRARDRARPRLRAQLRRPRPGASRHRAAEHPHQLPRRGQSHRLRPGALDPQERAHRARHRLRPHRLSRAGAGARRAGRRAHRHLRHRRHPVGAAHRPAAARHRRRRGQEPRPGAPPARRVAVAPDARAAAVDRRGVARRRWPPIASSATRRPTSSARRSPTSWRASRRAPTPRAWRRS